MADLNDLIGIRFENEDSREFEIVEADHHPNFDTARVVSRTDDYEVRGGADNTMAIDARDLQEEFRTGDFDVTDDNGAF